MLRFANKTMNFLYLICVLGGGVFLASCTDRDQVNDALSASCQKGISYLLGQYSMIKSVEEASFTRLAGKDDGDIRVVLDVIVDENHLDVRKSYSCNFFVKTGFLNSSFSANIAQIDMGNGEIYGRKDGQIYGGMNKWLNITKEAESAL